MDAAVAGLIGVAIGSASSLLTVYIQARFQERRERAKTVLDFAIRHRSEAFEYADRTQGQVVVIPLAAHVHFQQGLLRLIENDAVTAESLEALHRENEEITESIQKAKIARVVDRHLSK